MDLSSFTFNSKQYLQRSIIFLLILFVCDFLSGSLIKHLYFSVNKGTIGNLNKVTNSFDADVLVLGSSRASRHYVPNTIHQVTGLKSFNGGQDGRDIVYSSTILKLHIKHNKPKIVVLDLNLTSGTRLEEELQKIDILLPFYEDHSEIKDLVDKSGWRQRIKMYSKVYPYNSKLDTILKQKFTEGKFDEELGYLPLNRKITQREVDNLLKSSSSYNSFDNRLLPYLKDIVDICEQNNIKLLVFLSPNFKGFDNIKSFYSEVFVSLKKRGITIHDYYNDKRFNLKPDKFANRNHLNNDGAEYYTQIICEDIIKPLINKK